MKANINISIDSFSLLRAVAGLQGLLSNNVLPILRNFLFDVREKELTITASNEEVTVTTRLPLAHATGVEGAYRIAVPGSILVDTLKNLPEQPIEMRIAQESYRLAIHAQNGHYQIACENPLDAPAIPQADRKEAVTIPSGLLKAAIRQTLFAAGKGAQDLSICGVRLSIDAQGMTAVATDGYRVALHAVPKSFARTMPAVTLPSGSLSLLMQQLPEGEVPLDLLLSDRKVHCWVGALHIVCVIIDEPYPDYENIIPQRSRFQLTVSVQRLKGAIKLLGFYAPQNTHGIRLTLERDKMTLQAEDLEFSTNRAEMFLPCVYTGEPMELAINAHHFFEMVKNVHSEEMVIQLDAPQKAVVVRPEPAGKERILMLTMPIVLDRKS